MHAKQHVIFFRWFYSECSVEDHDFAQRKHININRTKVKKCSLHMYFELRDYCSSNIKQNLRIMLSQKSLSQCSFHSCFIIA